MIWGTLKSFNMATLQRFLNMKEKLKPDPPPDSKPKDWQTVGQIIDQSNLSMLLRVEKIKLEVKQRQREIIYARQQVLNVVVPIFLGCAIIITLLRQVFILLP